MSATAAESKMRSKAPAKTKKRGNVPAKTKSSRAEANRRNSLKSTGPRTAEGKDKSRHNAVTHGLTARSGLLPGEDADEFGALQQLMIDRFKPANDDELTLVGASRSTSGQATGPRRRAVGDLPNASDTSRSSGPGTKGTRRSSWAVGCCGSRPSRCPSPGGFRLAS